MPRRLLLLLAIVLVVAPAVTAQRYAPHSRLASGRWVKISVPATGIYELTDSLLRAAGFSRPTDVKVYGYGGAMQPEKLTAYYLAQTDDLPQVATCIVGGRRLFRAEGPVSWTSAFDLQRVRNPYSDCGCYFLSDSGTDEPLLLDSIAFADSFYPAADDFHSLYEVDDYAWYHGGRNLYDQRLFGSGVTRTYRLPSNGGKAKLHILMSYAGYCNATVMVADSVVGSIVIDEKTTKGVGRKQFTDSYSKAVADAWTFELDSLPETDSLDISIRQESGADMRLDYISLCFDQPRQLPSFSADVLPQPQIVGPVDCQDHHADTAADMVIIIPTSGILLEQAERLAQLHCDQDSMRVTIVKAGELYNEFSSGTPDANAYRRYLKMLYDRADSIADRPRFLVLFGDGAWDNRLRLTAWQPLTADDFLLCYESENSFSETNCYVTDDYFGMLDDNEGGDLIKNDKGDVAIGRMMARTADEARILVDKAYSYHQNSQPGAWQNIICMMGDDGNANMHMNDAEAVAGIVGEISPAFNVKKIYWDAYQRVSSAYGYAYPDVTQLILQQMREGALIMNYSGHGVAYTLSHERVVSLSDFKAPTSLRLPLWFTASCDVAPFDGYEENIGEAAVLNPTGGAIAFIGTSRTVYAQHNRAMNRDLMTHLLTPGDDGRPIAIGEALRQAKNDQVLGSRTTQQAGINKLHFTLLGDPALRLNMPTGQAVVDSINGMPVSASLLSLLAGDSATVSGHIDADSTYTGVVTITVKDAQQTITCRMNPLNADEMPKKPLVYNDRPSTLFVGSDSVRNGRFTVTFSLPKDVSYADDAGQILLYAVDDTHTNMTHGVSESFIITSADEYASNGEGPAIVAWLDSPDFADGGGVSSTPLLHADISDADGINVSGCGIGHDLELVIDGAMSLTYSLNGYFQYDFGNCHRGSVDFVLPALADGEHVLLLRAWDMLNNSSTVILRFVVGAQGIRSGIIDHTRPSPFPSRHAMTADKADGVAPSFSLYDLQGRQLSTPGNSGLVIYRTPSGEVKKMMRRKQ